MTERLRVKIWESSLAGNIALLAVMALAAGAYWLMLVNYGGYMLLSEDAYMRGVRHCVFVDDQGARAIARHYTVVDIYGSTRHDALETDCVIADSSPGAMLLFDDGRFFSWESVELEGGGTGALAIGIPRPGLSLLPDGVERALRDIPPSLAPILAGALLISAFASCVRPLLARGDAWKKHNAAADALDLLLRTVAVLLLLLLSFLASIGLYDAVRYVDSLQVMYLTLTVFGWAVVVFFASLLFLRVLHPLAKKLPVYGSR